MDFDFEVGGIWFEVVVWGVGGIGGCCGGVDCFGDVVGVVFLVRGEVVEVFGVLCGGDSGDCDFGGDVGVGVEVLLLCFCFVFIIGDGDVDEVEFVVLGVVGWVVY